ncbi:hypothetical protein OQA88_2532 [Cercophora sp. LCS_1]
MDASPPTTACGPTILNGRLCSRCRELTTYEQLDSISQGGSFEHYQLQQIMKNATDNPPCPLCAAIEKPFLGGGIEDVNPLWQVTLHLADEQGPEWLRNMWEKRGSYGFVGLSRGLSLSTKAPGDVDSMGYTLKLHLIADEDDPAASMTIRRPLLTDVASEKVFTMARSWLEICEETHQRCPKNSFKPELPSYVVNVSPDSPGAVAKLHKPASGERAKYLCLSYCWGNEGQLTTTKENLAVHLEAIPVDKLGLTIQDAITTTRRLGFRYLWVDALCIVQDDEVQKMAEIKAMASIYRNATALISAAVASASSKGFLHTRDFSYDDVKFKVRMPGGDVGNLGLIKENNFSPEHPLNARAWVLQEHLLSSRKFVFSEAELLVECPSAPDIVLRPSLLSYSYGNHIPPISTWDWETFDCTKRWSELVQMYSSRALTDPEDRLNAFEGVANEIERQSGKKVHYGIPEFGCEVLDWFARPRSPARSARAPSWSWGCLDTKVFCLSRQDQSGKYDERSAHLRFAVDGDPAKLAITASVIDGATWDGLHPIDETAMSSEVYRDKHYTCLPDVRTGLPDPRNRHYLQLSRTYASHETILILESAGCGTYRRTGIYYGSDFVGKWPEERREVTLL